MKAALRNKSNDENANRVVLNSGKSFPVQRNLKIGSVNDPMEREADNMANRVMRMPESQTIQRKCTECEEEEGISRKPLASQITPFVQRKSNDSGVANADVSRGIQSSRGEGKSLPPRTRNFMESRFGADFSEVRVHTGSRASKLSNDLDAKAFTVGKDVYFNKGQYAPETSSGKQLLAHELTHVVQQTHAPKIQRLWKGTTAAPTPAGTTNHRGSAQSAQWLQGHRNAGNQFSETVLYLFGWSSLSSQTTTDIATRCNQQGSFQNRMTCLHDEVHNAVMVLEGRDGDLTDNDYVCRNYAMAVHDVSQQMGLSPDVETSTTHAWIEFNNNGRQYVVDAFNEILFSHPAP